jgi:phosphoglycolate phosphatase
MSIPPPYPQKWPRAVIFDWDNTLVDTWLTCYEAFNATLEEFQAPFCLPEVFYKQPHYSVRDLLPHYLGKASQKAESFFYQKMHETHLENLRALPGAEKLLQLLWGRNVYIAIVSNKEGNILRKEVKHLGWDHYFGCVIGSRDTLEDKPSPLPLLTALKETHISPGHDVWFVGDSSVDSLCAKNANCIPVAVSQNAILADTPTIYGKDCLGISSILTRL